MSAENKPNPTGTPGIICLPDELILAICGYLQEDPDGLDHDTSVNYLCNLSVVCRRLHYLALPLCLPESKTSHIPSAYIESPADIRPLCLALSLRSIGILSVWFKDESYIETLRRLLNLVENVSSISIVTLRFPPLWELYPKGPELLLLLSTLLQKLSERSCRNLELKHLYGWEGLPPYFLGLLVKPPELSVKSTHVVTPFAKLDDLSIHSIVVFLPPMLTQTISIINTSLITVFDLSCEYLTSEFCSALFALLQLNSLREFTIWYSSIWFGDFQKFSLRHKTIESFESFLEARPFDYALPAFSLPKLNHIKASYETVLCLLQQREPESLPALTSVKISLEIFSGPTFVSLLQIINSYPKITRLALTADWGPFSSFLREFLQTRAHEVKLLNIIDISINRRWAGREESIEATGTLLSQWVFCCFPNTKIIQMPSDICLPIHSSIILAQTLLKHIPWMPSVHIGFVEHGASCWLSQDMRSSVWVCKKTGEHYE